MKVNKKKKKKTIILPPDIEDSRSQRLDGESDSSSHNSLESLRGVYFQNAPSRASFWSQSSSSSEFKRKGPLGKVIARFKKKVQIPKFDETAALTSRKDFDSRWKPGDKDCIAKHYGDGIRAGFFYRCAVFREESKMWLRSYVSVWYYLFTVILWCIALQYIDDKMGSEKFKSRFHMDEAWLGVFTGVVGLTLVFRINLAYQRWWEARRSIEVMSGRWFYFAILSNVFDQFTITTSKEHYLFRRRINGLISLLHAAACVGLHPCERMRNMAFSLLNSRDIQTVFSETAYSIYKMDNNVGDPTVKRPRSPPRDEVVQILVWLHVVMVGRFHGHVVGGPILARLYTMLEDGFQAYLDALTLRTTAFPTPFRHIVNIGIILIHVFIPMHIHLYTSGSSLIWRMTLSCASTYSFVALSVVARELEYPFGDDYFDHPVRSYQLDFDLELKSLIDCVTFAPPKPLDVEDFQAKKQDVIVPLYDEDALNDPDGAVGASENAFCAFRLTNTYAHLRDPVNKSDLHGVKESLLNGGDTSAVHFNKTNALRRRHLRSAFE